MDASLVLTLFQTFLQVLDSFISRENQSVWGYESQLRKLRDTISIIEAVLSNVEKHERLQLPCSIPPVTLDRLKEAVYEADDLFDEIATLAQRKKLSMPGNKFKVGQEVRLFFSRFNQFYYAFTKSREIKKIRERLDAIAKDHRDFGSMQVQAPNLEVGNHSRETHSFVCEEDVIIGRDEDKQKVLDMLLDDTVEEVVSVVSIVGIGGLGKTTLAQLVYNDVRIQSKFQLKMWVCVSDSFDVKLLLYKILAATTNESNSGLSLEQLQINLRQKLQGNKYLLVLDDIWNEDRTRWLELRKLLSHGGSGSRIIVTTRSRFVASIVGSHKNDRTHELGGLSEEDSWKLFEQMTLEPGKDQMEQKLVDVGRAIVHKCVNVPLALKVIGSLLRGQDEYKWRNFANTDLANIVPDKSSNIKDVLKISYNYLPPCLKSCFSYCAVFPKDYRMMKDDLIYLWMAQGFIMPSDGQTFEDVGEEYFMSLVQRCFFQEVVRDDIHGVMSCKMHDLVHDLTEKVAGIETMSCCNDMNSLDDKFRHISIDDSIVECNLAQVKRLRTFFGYGSNFIGSYDWLPKMRYLRVLDLSHRYSDGKRSLKRLPSKVGQLMHLRYLDLSYNVELSVLPNSITQLCNMQTLRLKRCKSLKELPRELSKLVKLRHLDIQGCEELRHMPSGMNKMTCLHKLPMFVLGGSNYGSCGVGNLGDMKYLDSLTDWIEIKMREGWTCDAAEVKEGGYMMNKPLLNEIEIFWNLECVDNDNAEALLQGLQPHPNVKQLRLYKYPGMKFPSWGDGDLLTMNLNNPLPNLVKLELHKCPMLKHVPLLSQLRHLKDLTLEELMQLEYVESRDNGSTSGGDGVATASGGTSTRQAHDVVFFPSLESLQLYYLGELKGWWKAALHLDSNSEGGEIELGNKIDEQLQQQQESSSASVKAFPCLSHLRIWGCPNLTTFPSLPNLQELRLKGSHKALRYFDSLPRESLQHLSSLSIDSDEEIERLSTREVFQSGRLSSLCSLEFYKCSKMKSVSERGVWDHFTCLETLKLQYLEELEMEEKEGEDESMPWRCLAPSLRSLRLWGLPKMVGKLPKGMRHLTALRSLSIRFCENLEEIPGWISCLTSLNHLELWYCPKVKSLPEEMCHLTSLKELTLIECSAELKEGCSEGTGADWHLIQHIPTIRLSLI